MVDPAETDWVGAYQASRYAFPLGGSWYEVALDGEEPPLSGLGTSVTLITAWNPGSEEQSLSWNQAANARLLRCLVAARVPWGPAWGGSLPGTEPAWREEGFTLYGLEPEEAARWGREWGQRAIVQLRPTSSELLFCKEERAVSCGLRRFA